MSKMASRASSRKRNWQKCRFDRRAAQSCRLGAPARRAQSCGRLRQCSPSFREGQQCHCRQVVLRRLGLPSLPAERLPKSWTCQRGEDQSMWRRCVVVPYTCGRFSPLWQTAVHERISWFQVRTPRYSQWASARARPDMEQQSRQRQADIRRCLPVKPSPLLAVPLQCCRSLLCRGESRRNCCSPPRRLGQHMRRSCCGASWSWRGEPILSASWRWRLMKTAMVEKTICQKLSQDSGASGHQVVGVEVHLRMPIRKRR